MRISWKAAVVPATIILLVFFTFIAPVVVPTQAANNVLLSMQAQQGPFILKATRIDGTNAHLQLAPDPAFPIFMFDSTTMQGLQIIATTSDGHTVTTTASGQATATNVAIKTAIGYEIASALQSFSNPADLLILSAGGTVAHLTMTNVTLVIDHSLASTALAAAGFQIAITTGTVAMPAQSHLTLAQVAATLTPTLTPSATLTLTPTSTITPVVTTPPSEDRGLLE